jgi:hypothetical protein
VAWLLLQEADILLKLLNIFVLLLYNFWKVSFLNSQSLNLVLQRYNAELDHLILLIDQHLIRFGCLLLTPRHIRLPPLICRTTSMLPLMPLQLRLQLLSKETLLLNDLIEILFILITLLQLRNVILHLPLLSGQLPLHLINLLLQHIYLICELLHLEGWQLLDILLPDQLIHLTPLLILLTLFNLFLLPCFLLLLLQILNTLIPRLQFLNLVQQLMFLSVKHIYLFLLQYW